MPTVEGAVDALQATGRPASRVLRPTHNLGSNTQTHTNDPFTLPDYQTTAVA